MSHNEKKQPTFRYLRQSRRSPYPTRHVSELMSQWRDAETRRHSMTPSIPVSPNRFRVAIRKYNVRYADLWSNNARYLVSRPNIVHSQLLHSSNNEEGNDNGATSSDQAAAQSRAQLSYQDYNARRLRLAAQQQAEAYAANQGAIADQQAVAAAFDEAVVATYQEAATAANQAVDTAHAYREEEAARRQAEAPTIDAAVYDSASGNVQLRGEEDNEPPFVAGSMGEDGASNVRVLTNGNRQRASYEIIPQRPPNNLLEMLSVYVEDSWPGTDTVPATNQSWSDVTNPTEIEEMQTLEAIQAFENYLQDILNGIESVQSGSLALESNRLHAIIEICRDFILHPRLVLQFQRRALEYNAKEALNALKRLSPARQILPEEEGEDCVICLMKFESRSEIRALICHHKFHTYCIDTWCRTSLTCPVCRGNVNGYSVNQHAATDEDLLGPLELIGLEYVRNFLMQRRNRREETDRPGPSTSRD